MAENLESDREGEGEKMIQDGHELCHHQKVGEEKFLYLHRITSTMPLGDLCQPGLQQGVFSVQQSQLFSFILPLIHYSRYRKLITEYCMAATINQHHR
jgi:hypothetical protein